MMRSRYTIAIVCISALSLLAMAIAPSNPKPRTTSGKRVKLLHADKLFFNDHINAKAQILIGDVQFEHDGTLMYCDSALFYQDENSFDAYGHVRMKQGDTLSLVGDELYYDGIAELARVRYNVILRHRNTNLYTDSLDYDRVQNLGYFFDGGRLEDEQSRLTSEMGEYNTGTRIAKFLIDVKLQNPRPPREVKSTMEGDTLYYNTATSVAHAVGPSNLYSGDNHIYTENGYYNTKTDESYMLDRSRLRNRFRTLVGDSVCWDGQLQVGKAYGNAEYNDTENKNMFLGNYALYNDSTGYAEASDSALLIDYSQHDTLFAHADSLFMYTYNINTDSMYRMFHAYHHVRVFRNDLQAVCDSLVFDERDSCATMYQDPIIWQETQQLLGEKIMVWFNDSTPDSAYVVNQALSVERMDEKHYNQIASTEMHTYFEEGKVRLMIADRNVLVNYFPLDDDSLLIGMNHTESSEMRMFMKDSKVEKIWMPAATGTMYPIPLIPPRSLYLDNFAWFDYMRPKDKDDVFNWRPKTKGTELKPTILREAPRQQLTDIAKTKQKRKN